MHIPAARCWACSFGSKGGVASSAKEEDDDAAALAPRSEKRRRGQGLGLSSQAHLSREEWLRLIKLPMVEVMPPTEIREVEEQGESQTEEGNAEVTETVRRLNRDPVLLADLERLQPLFFEDQADKLQHDMALLSVRLWPIQYFYVTLADPLVSLQFNTTQVEFVSRAECLSELVGERNEQTHHFRQDAKEKAERVTKLKTELEKVRKEKKEGGPLPPPSTT